MTDPVLCKPFGVLYYPPGETNVGTDENPVVRNNFDIARELIEVLASHGPGAVLTLSPGWEYVPPPDEPVYVVAEPLPEGRR